MTDLIERLRDYVKWTREANDENNPDPYSKITLDDIDAETLNEAANEIERQKQRNEFLFRALKMANRDNARLRKALEEIVNPLPVMQERAKAEGRQLSGMAYGIANSVSYLQDIAKQALTK